jgi:hypothetical protein
MSEGDAWERDLLRLPRRTNKWHLVLMRPSISAEEFTGLGMVASTIDSTAPLTLSVTQTDPPGRRAWKLVFADVLPKLYFHLW